MGVWTITNTLAVELIEVRYGIEDEAVLRYGSETIETPIVYCNGDAFVEVGELVLRFSECIRVA